MIELRQIIDNLIEKRGNFQILVIILICFNSIEVGINHTITSFHIYTPEYYCKDDTNKNTDSLTNCNQTCSSGYQFDENDEFALVGEFSLVCNRKYISSLLNTLYFVGVTVGALVCSSLCDLWGRKWVVLGCMYIQAIMSLGIYFTNNLIWFAVFRMIQGLFVQGLQTCSYTLMMEYCPSRFRTMAAICWELNWCLGMIILGGVAWIVPNWRLLSLIMITPTALSLLYFWLIPESIMWLYANNRWKEALNVVRQVAKRNKDEYILDECKKIDNLIVLQNENSSNSIRPDEINKKEKIQIMDIFRNTILKKHLIVMICVWFSVTLSYYGILYFLPTLPGSRHGNFLAGAGIEALANFFAFFLLRKFGRRILMVIFQYANAILLVTMGLLALVDKNETAQTFLTIFSLIAKGFAVASFTGQFMYCSELFPTVCRGIAMGLCGFSARIGSLIAPQLMLLIGVLPTYVPMIIIAALITISGTATLLLPETVKSKLPDTMEEANALWAT